MSALCRDGGIFITSTLNTLSMVANVFSILASRSFIRSCAVRGTCSGIVRTGEDSDVCGCGRSLTFFLKLLDEQRQPALSHLPAQLLPTRGSACVSRPPQRHLVVLSSRWFRPCGAGDTSGSPPHTHTCGRTTLIKVFTRLPEAQRLVARRKDTVNFKCVSLKKKQRSNQLQYLIQLKCHLKVENKK